MSSDKTPSATTRTYAEGRLLARPAHSTQAETIGDSGSHALGLDNGRDGLLFVPASYGADRPTPLVIMLHGAGGMAQRTLASMQPFADAAGIILLVPDSRRQTWDVIIHDYGPDIAFIDRALQQTFSRYVVDTTRLAIGGFSDGASYALSVGLTNGDLFTHVIAFSPGFMVPASQQGAPRIYISHGTRDEVLPIDPCSRRIVPQLQRAGYDVRYHEFDGPHTVPPEIAQEGIAWFVGEGN